MELEAGDIGQLNTYRPHERGQALVEFLIIAPILIFFIIGILEVGVVLRNYLVLINANRELARFSIRPEYIDLDAANEDEIGYTDILTYSEYVLGKQLFVNKVEQSGMVINVVNIDTGFPCDPIENTVEIDGKFILQCDCELIATEPYTPYIITNRNVNSRYGFSSPITQTSRFDIDQWSLDLAKENDQFNCISMNTGAQASRTGELEVVIVENFYDHYQLFGFPFISNPYTNPVTLYTYMVMRRSPIRDSPFEDERYR